MRMIEMRTCIFNLKAISKEENIMYSKKLNLQLERLKRLHIRNALPCNTCVNNTKAITIKHLKVLDDKIGHCVKYGTPS